MTTVSPAPVIEGALVRLRPLRPTDRDARLALGRDAEYVRLNGGDPDRATGFSAEDARRWYASFPDSLRWVIERHDRLIGEARLDAVARPGSTIRFAIGVFAPGDRDRGVGTEVTRLVARHAFESLAVTRIDLRVLASNARAIHCYEKCGYVTYARQRDRSFIAGRWHDDLLMRLSAESYRARRAAWFGD